MTRCLSFIPSSIHASSVFLSDGILVFLFNCANIIFRALICLCPLSSLTGRSLLQFYFYLKLQLWRIIFNISYILLRDYVPPFVAIQYINLRLPSRVWSNFYTKSHISTQVISHKNVTIYFIKLTCDCV